MYGYFADAEELALANTALGEGALASVNIAPRRSSEHSTMG